MFCTFALETKVPRIVPGGTISAGYPGLTPVMNVPCVPTQTRTYSPSEASAELEMNVPGARAA